MTALTLEREGLPHTLRRELEFLVAGGYREPNAWAPLIFEDSPICRKSSGGDCSDGECGLLTLIPSEHRHRPSPCRYIPLNAAGETVNHLYETATQDELEAALREWLTAMLRALERSD